MAKFYYYNTGNGRKCPVMKNDDGGYTIYDLKSRKPLKGLTDKLIHSFGKDGLRIFEKRCTIARVKGLEDLFDRMDKADKLTEIIIRLDKELYEAASQRKSLLYPVLSYADTKSMGCTDIVYWDNERQNNPETGNEFFRPQDAINLFEKLKMEYADEIEDEHDEVWQCTHYIWHNADLLDDLIQEELLNK
ncbi:MAG: hypothetical protein J6Q22_08045 [Prevotella sp.]|nr:hypothetical protein [Prevotella sp.]